MKVSAYDCKGCQLILGSCWQPATLFERKDVTAYV